MQMIQTNSGSYINAAQVEAFVIWTMKDSYIVQARMPCYGSDEYTVYEIARFGTKEEAQAVLNVIAKVLSNHDPWILRGADLENNMKECVKNESD